MGATFSSSAPSSELRRSLLGHSQTVNRFGYDTGVSADSTGARIATDPEATGI
jgi:hypothetical protein